MKIKSECNIFFLLCVLSLFGVSLLLWACKEKDYGVKGSNFKNQDPPLLNWGMFEQGDTFVKIRYDFMSFGSRVIKKVDFLYSVDSSLENNIFLISNLDFLNSSNEFTIKPINPQNKYWGKFIIYTDIDSFHFGVKLLMDNQKYFLTLFGKDLIAWYPFDGDAKDYSGFDNHGVLTGVTLDADRDNQANRCYRFNGSNSYIQIPHNPIFNVDDFTIAMWFNAADYTDGNQGNQRILISKREGSGWGNSFESVLTTNGLNGFGVNWTLSNTGNGYFCYFNNNLKQSTWYFMTYVHKTDSAHLFLNGMKVASIVTGRTLNYNTLPITIGQRGNGLSKFRGLLDNVTIWSRALTNNEIKSLYLF